MPSSFGHPKEHPVNGRFQLVELSVYTEISMQSEGTSAANQMPWVGLAVADAFSDSHITMTVLITGPCVSLAGPAEDAPENLPRSGGYGASLQSLPDAERRTR